MGLFDRLQKEIEIHEEGGGYAVVDGLTLPAPLRKIMNLVTRRRLVAWDELLEETQATPEELAAWLAELTDMGYLLEIATAGQRQYKVVFSRKRGRRVPFNVWDTLGGKVEGQEGE